jgi:hypothetical protein
MKLNSNEWSETQNEDYLALSEKRLLEPKLKWVKQFCAILNKEIKDSILCTTQAISLNDYGCNVGHFFRGLDEVSYGIDYRGFDVSSIYLDIAKKTFGNKHFHMLDVSDSSSSNEYIFKCDISVISATLEHIEDYEAAVSNIFKHTSNLVIMRTFVGEFALKDICRTIGAKADYIIRQFTIEDLVRIPLELGWSYRQEVDIATMGVLKMTCNSTSIPRKQAVLVFFKQ